MSALVCGVLGATIGGLVTSRLHAGSGFWARRLGRSRFRRANLPIGGAVAVAAVTVLPSLAEPLLAAGSAMAVTAIGWRYVDPLPSP